MDKEISTAIISGVGGTVLSALVTGLFARGRGKIDLTLSDRTMLQKERELLASEAKIYRDELKERNALLEKRIRDLELLSEAMEATHEKAIGNLIGAVAYWMRQTLETKDLSELQDHPVFPEIVLLNEAAKLKRHE